MKIAVVGTGYWGVNLVRVFHKLDALDSVCDLNISRAQTLAAAYPGVRLSRSYEALVNDPATDGIVIATPAETHYQLARQALLAGKDVLVEKPMTLHSGETEDLVSIAEGSRRILMVGHLLEFHPAILRLRSLIQEGCLGRIEYIYSNRLNLGKVRREENALWSFAPHDISVILLLLNQLPIQVTATGGTYLQPNIADVTVSTMLFGGGTRAHIFVSWLHPFKEQKLVIVGEKRMAVFDDVSKSDKLRLYDKKIDLVDGEFRVERPVPTTIEFPEDEPLMSECRHFVECIQSRQTPRTDGRDAWRVLKVLEASQRSLSMNGIPVAIEAGRDLTSVVQLPDTHLGAGLAGSMRPGTGNLQMKTAE
jgi:UDP-2-acetamido-3-amino-2,3-dideoxy-glucuronate N-acetyltransferase